MLFSAPSIMCVSMPENVSPSDIGVGFAPSRRTRSMNMSDEATRSFRPCRSFGVTIGWRVL